jgi:hypothetical protein
MPKLRLKLFVSRAKHDREVAALSGALRLSQAATGRALAEKDTLYGNNQRHLKRIADLERDVDARDLTHRSLAEERDTALETVGLLAADGETDVLRRVVVDHIASGLRSTSPGAADLARALQSELWLAGLSVDADINAAIGGAS